MLYTPLDLDDKGGESRGKVLSDSDMSEDDHSFKGHVRLTSSAC